MYRVPYDDGTFFYYLYLKKLLNGEFGTNVPSQKSRSIMCHFKSIQSTLFPIGTTTTIPGTAGATVKIPASTQPPSPLPSFHSCRAGGGSTLLTSLITALIYSGVNSRRWKPFAELTVKERKKDEFPQRLTDTSVSSSENKNYCRNIQEVG